MACVGQETSVRGTCPSLDPSEEDLVLLCRKQRTGASCPFRGVWAHAPHPEGHRAADNNLEGWRRAPLGVRSWRVSASSERTGAERPRWPLLKGGATQTCRSRLPDLCDRGHGFREVTRGRHGATPSFSLAPFLRNKKTNQEKPQEIPRLDPSSLQRG